MGVTRFYVDAAGVYLGGFDGAEPPENAIEVSTPPDDARQVWDGSAWGAIPADPPPKPTPLAWLERLPEAKQDAIATAAMGNASINLWLLKAAGVPEIDVTDPRTIAGVQALVAAGVLTSEDQAVMLAP
jgi:hypothetical protein